MHHHVCSAAIIVSCIILFCPALIRAQVVIKERIEIKPNTIAAIPYTSTQTALFSDNQTSLTGRVQTDALTVLQPCSIEINDSIVVRLGADGFLHISGAHL